MNGTLLATLAVSFAVFVLALAGIGLGLMAGRRPLAGSCGRANAGRCPCHPDHRPCDAWRER